MGKYVLIGIPYGGKTAVGQRAAEMLGMPFYNTDKIAFERADFDSPTRVFMISGRHRLFAELYKLLEELVDLDGPAIIEVQPECGLDEVFGSEILKRIGAVIYIKRDPESAIEDVKKDERRIIMQEVNTGHKIDMQVNAVTLYAKEARHLEALADMTLDNNGTVEEAAEKLAGMIRGREGDV
jgi:shikimate kinase